MSALPLLGQRPGLGSTSTLRGVKRLPRRKAPCRKPRLRASLPQPRSSGSAARARAIPRLPKNTSWRTSAAAEAEHSSRTFRRFRELVRNKEGNHRESDLQTYVDAMAKLREELKDFFEEYAELPASTLSFGLPLAIVANEFVDSFHLHAQRMLQIAQTGKTVPHSYYERDLEMCMTPKVRGITGLCNVLQDALKTTLISISFVLAIQLSGVDIFAEFRSPVYGWRIDWLIWTVPYAVVVYFFWNSRISKKWNALKGFKFSTAYFAFRRYAVKDPRSYYDFVLVMNALHVSWITTVAQGLGFYLFEAVCPRLYGADIYSIGFSLTSPLPSIVWLPVELLVLGSIAGAWHLIADGSLLVSADALLRDEARYSNMDARHAAKTLDQFNLLNDPQICRDRASITFLYYFSTVSYLSVEALSVHSLFASMATLTIGHFLTYKGMQKSLT